MSKELRALERARSRVTRWRRLMALLWVAAASMLALCLFGIGAMVYGLVWGGTSDGAAGFGLYLVGAVAFAISVAGIVYLDEESPSKGLELAEAAYEAAVERAIQSGR